tara:strand:+ start:376 stop:660 length:285 start_codon:yes stop_codon:yes gene_type:complete
MWKVTYAIDSLDPNPTIKYFDSYDEAENWLQEEVLHRVQWTVEHSPYSISEEELSQIEELEYSLVKFETADHDIVEWFKHYTNWEHQKIIDHVL